MDYMMDLKDLLCAELEEYAEKGKKSGKMSAADLDGIHKLTDTVKNILKINMLEEEMDDGYSGKTNWMGEGRMYGSTYDGGNSYARRGRYAKRDSMGRYSRDTMHRDGMDGAMHHGMRRDGYSMADAKHHMMEQLEDMMEQAETPKQKEALQRCMQAIERA